MSVSIGATADRDTWLAWRRNGLGGSDIAGVLGISPWSSPWSVWADKVGVLPDQPDNEYMEAGRWLEKAIGPWFTDRTGLAVLGEQTWLEHPTHPWMRCTVDGFVAESPGSSLADVLGLLEIKTAQPGRRWDEIPAGYQAQGLWQMAVAGLDRVWFAVLMGRRLDIHELERDQDEIDYMIERAEKFWRGHVLPADPPPVDDHEATSRAIAALYPRETPGVAESLDDLAEVIDEWRHAGFRKRTAETSEREAANAIRAALGHAEEGTVAGDRVVTLRAQTRTTTCKGCGRTETSNEFRVLRPARARTKGNT
jgi:putative phage-type endonuclease